MKKALQEVQEQLSECVGDLIILGGYLTSEGRRRQATFSTQIGLFPKKMARPLFSLEIGLSSTPSDAPAKALCS